MKKILFSFVFVLGLVGVGFGQTLMGYNNSRIMDQLTDDSCNILRDRVESIKQEVPENMRAVMRFPGGTIARYYDIDAGGYDGRGKTCNGENYIDKFIEVMQYLGGQVTLVMSVGAWDRFFWDIDSSQEQDRLDKNRRMIEKFIDAQIPIFAVELGNEEMYHVPQLNYANPNMNYNWLQRLFGVPQRDANNRRIIDEHYDNYVRIYKLHVDLLNDISRERGIALPAAVPMVTNSVPRRRAWNDRVAAVPAKYGVFHHYEDQIRDNRQRRYDDNLNAIRGQDNLVDGGKRIPISTERGVWFHDQGDRNFHLVGQYKVDYESWFREYSRQQGVPLIMQHRLNGNPATWGDGMGSRGGSISSVPYDRKSRGQGKF